MRSLSVSKASWILLAQTGAGSIRRFQRARSAAESTAAEGTTSGDSPVNRYFPHGTSRSCLRGRIESEESRCSAHPNRPTWVVTWAESGAFR